MLDPIDDHRYSPPPPTRRPRIALAHDWLVGYRGGEAVLEHLCRVANRLGKVAGLYTMFADPQALAAFPADDHAGLRSIDHVSTSFLSRLPGSRPLRRWMLPAYPAAVRELSRRLAADHARAPIDLLLSTSSAAIKNLAPPRGARHICYCHTPARYLWGHQAAYTRGTGGRLRGAGLSLFGQRLRDWDRTGTRNVHVLLANSTHVQALIRRCYDRDSTVVHPPVDTAFFTPASAPRSGLWLSVGALEPYKRVDLAIRAAAIAKARLAIVGTGSQRRFLEALAADARSSGAHIEFLGRASPERLRELYQTAGVLLFPQEEDFGIVAVEAQSCGLPVAALDAGGARDTVIPNSTGAFFKNPDDPAALAAAARSCLNLRDVAAACRRNAERFGVERFETQMSQIISGALG